MSKRKEASCGSMLQNAKEKRNKVHLWRIPHFHFCICPKHKMNGTMLLFTFFCPLNIYNNLYMDQRCSLHKMNNPQGPKCKTPRATSMQDPLTKWSALLHSAENFTPKPYIAFYIWAREVFVQKGQNAGGYLQKQHPSD